MANTFEQFGKYILLEKIATGGMAEVYLAKSQGANGVNKFLAIKRILPQFSDNQEFIEMFKEEAKIAVNLNHGNVVPIYDFGVEKGQFYLVMEYVEGRNLRQIINELKKKNHPFSIEQVVFMIKEVSAGLDHAHRCIDGSTGKPLNITHRDMSPQNIMVSFEGEVKIIDFGIAKAENQIEVTKAGTLKGKFGYMSPEQAEGLPIDLRTDIFSLGIVLWELLANDRLFTSTSEAAILRKIRDCNVPSVRKINPSVHPELERIVNKALAKDKSLRYQTSAALHRDLNRFLNTQYPEFSPHDFSVFIKNAFVDLFTDQRKKLVDFARVQGFSEETASTTANLQNSQVSKTLPRALDSKPASKVDNGSTLTKAEEESAELQISTASDIRVDLKTLKRDGAVDPRHRGTQIGLDARLGTISGSTSSEVPQYTFSTAKARRQKPTASSSSSTFIAMALTVLLVGGIGYIIFGKSRSSVQEAQESADWYSKRPPIPSDPPVIIDPTPSHQPSTVETNLPGKRPVASPEIPASSENAVAMIFSEPMDAQIFINGKDTGFRTPYRLTMPLRQTFTLKLKKEGYFKLEKNIILLKPATTIENKLDKESYGFVKLSVNNPGSKPRVEIDGELVDKELPFTYRIRAGVPVKIQVQNEFLNTSATEVISVDENQKKSVDLILKSQR